MESRMDRDVVIVGAGLAGAALATIFGRRGISTAIVDPRTTCPPMFKAEKIEPEQAELFRRLDLFEIVRPHATPIRSVKSARSGHVLRSVRMEQYGIFYDEMVNAVRGAIPQAVERISGRVEDIAISPSEQRVVLDGGRRIACRLVIVATGTVARSIQSLGFRRRMIDVEHSLNFGFNVERSDGGPFAFDSISYYSDDVALRYDFLTLFPIGAVMRANLFSYRQAKEPWVKALAETPERALANLAPGLLAMTMPFRVVSKIEMRSIDLYRVENPARPGIVLAGDAYQSVCPATGYGLTKVLTDVGVLDRAVPRWLSTPGMSEEKTSELYRAPEKIEADERAIARAIHQRRLAIDDGLAWRVKRLRTFGAMWLRGQLELR
jgi:2-polyprenyl-6-methoxyphenol hydroxylase-like FAD-dependent oxidoreductase